MDSVVCAFGVRNVTDMEAGLREVLRVLKPGARFYCLEASQPWRPLRPLHAAFCRYLVPRLGCWVTRVPEVFDYLADSLVEFPEREAIKRLFESVGFVDVACRSLSLGVVCLHSGRKPGGPSAPTAPA